jgi:hypothetical protein
MLNTAWGLSLLVQLQKAARMVYVLRACGVVGYSLMLRELFAVLMVCMC